MSRSLIINHQGYEEGVRAVFEHAKRTPCSFLILEDLDLMLPKELRSLFLKEFEGVVRDTPYYLSGR